jgi:hypothetical protein
MIALVAENLVNSSVLAANFGLIVAKTITSLIGKTTENCVQA